MTSPSPQSKSIPQMDDQLKRLDDLLDRFEAEVARQALTDFSVRSAQLIAARSALREYLSERVQEAKKATREATIGYD